LAPTPQTRGDTLPLTDSTGDGTTTTATPQTPHRRVASRHLSSAHRRKRTHNSPHRDEATTDPPTPPERHEAPASSNIAQGPHTRAPVSTTRKRQTPHDKGPYPGRATTRSGACTHTISANETDDPACDADNIPAQPPKAAASHAHNVTAPSAYQAHAPEPPAATSTRAPWKAHPRVFGTRTLVADRDTQ